MPKAVSSRKGKTPKPKAAPPKKGKTPAKGAARQADTAEESTSTVAMQRVSAPDGPSGLSDCMAASDDELPVEPARSSSVGIDAHLEDITKLKIVQGRYVHLCTLLPNHRQVEKVVLSKSDGLVSAGSSNRKLYNISEWIDAFLIYAGVRATAQPGEAAALFRYMQTIKRLHDRGANFVKYDESFRCKHRGQPSIPWHVLDTEEFSWATGDPRFTPFEEYMKQGQQSRGGKGMTPASYREGQGAKRPAQNKGPTCYMYNYSGKCTQAACKYRHACIKCGGSHAYTECKNKTAK